MSSIWHSHFFRHWRAGWRLITILGGVYLACVLPVYLGSLLVASILPESQQEPVGFIIYLVYFLSVFPYFFHRLMNRIGFGVLDMLRPPPTAATVRPEK
jgi:hypothetical protein